MNEIRTIHIDYDAVSKARQLEASSGSNIKVYSMLSPSDVPSDAVIELSKKKIIVKFTYDYENEKKSIVSIMDGALILDVGKNSKKIYGMQFDVDKVEKYIKIKRIASFRKKAQEAAKEEVRKQSYSAIKEVYKRYLKDIVPSSYSFSS